MTALTVLAGSCLINDEFERLFLVADRALDLAVELGLPEPLRALGFRGGARVGLGDVDGLVELERARDLLIAGGGGRDAVVMANNYAVNTYEIEGPAKGVPAHEAAIALAEARGVTTVALRSDYLGMLVDVGRLEEIVATGDRVCEDCLEQGFTGRAAGAAASMARALCETGAVHEALGHAAVALEHLGEGMQPALVDLVGGELVTVFTAAGRHDDARALLERIVTDPRRNRSASQRLPALVRGAVAIGDRDLATRLCEGVSPHWPMFADGPRRGPSVHLAEAEGDTGAAVAFYADARERWGALGASLEEAYAVLGQGRCLATLGDPAAESVLRDARRLFTAIAARARVEECDAILGRVSRRSS